MHDLHELSTRILTMDFYQELVLARGPLKSEGHITLCLARKDPSSDAQKFKFAPVVNGQTYLIVCKDGERSLDVMNSSYAAGTDIILTGQPEQVTPGRNKQWIVEACGDRIESLMTYTGKRKQVATVTDSRGYTTTNTYDAGGNLTSKEEYAYTTGSVGTAENSKSYAYRATGWKDQMTAYDGQSITYDNMGNPLSYRGMQMTWQKGRELKGVEKDSTAVTYAYNQEGVRIRKMVGDTETRYYLNGSKIVALESGSEKLHFIYDQSGNLFAMKAGSELYYYLHNCQNDITGLVDSMGTQVVSYQYDSWDKPVGMTDATADGVGSKNPFRYREYCWDEETELYYVNSRYYDPETCRFISADNPEFLTNNCINFEQYNLYTYCWNNPVNMLDQDGTWPQWVKKAIAVAVVATAVVAATVATVATFGAASVAGVAAITATATFAVRTTEVAVLQAKKSKKEGKSKKKIATNIVESIYNNRRKIIGITPITKSASIGINHALNVQTGGISGGKISLRTTLGQPGGKLFAYGFVAYNWAHTMYSIFSKDPIKRAKKRGIN